MPIPDTVTIEITCGYLTVPENRDDPASDPIRLAVAYLHSPAPDARPDPVVELTGGPGFSSLDGVEGWATSPILEHRDLILFDQRGLGFSEPNLDCPETNEAVLQVFATNDAPIAEGEVMRASLQECRSRARGRRRRPRRLRHDPDGRRRRRPAARAGASTSGTCAACRTDRPSRRRCCGTTPKVFGRSCSTRSCPPDTAFSGVERGESALRAIGALADASAASATCTESYGDLRALIADAAAALDAAPYEVAIADPDGGSDRTVSIDGGDFYAGVFDLMYDAELLPVIPVAAQAIAGGDNSLIDAYASEGVAFLADQHEAMTFSVDCADRQALMDAAAVDPFVAAHPEMEWLVQLGAHELICPAWGVESNPAPFNELLTAAEVDVPVLVMAGAFDPVTPPDGSRRVAEALGVELVLLPNAGHGAVGLDCGRAIWFAFLDDPTVPPDTSCVAEQEPPFA